MRGSPGFDSPQSTRRSRRVGDPQIAQILRRFRFITQEKKELRKWGKGSQLVRLPALGRRAAFTCYLGDPISSIAADFRRLNQESRQCRMCCRGRGLQRMRSNGQACNPRSSGTSLRHLGVLRALREWNPAPFPEIPGLTFAPSWMAKAAAKRGPVDAQCSPQEKASRKADTPIVVLEEHPLLRHGIAHLLNSQEDMIVCGDTDNIRDARHKIRGVRSRTCC